MRTANRGFCRSLAWWLSAVVVLVLSVSQAVAADQPGPMLQRFLKGPMKGVDEIVFSARISGRDHWYVTFGNYSCRQGPGERLGFGDYIDGCTPRGYADGGRLCRYNLRTGEVKIILDDKEGGIRDPQVHYDGQKILFSYRPGKSPTFHLHEINIDGTGLQQLTDGPDDDIEPVYLPDGNIIFCSSRCQRFVNCWFTRVAVLYRCDADGKNVRMVSTNNDHDNTPCVLPDGRILYMRWEYVDRSQVHFHHLWTVNPDGTGQMVYFGNEFAGTSMLDPQPIPGTNKAVASFSPGHGLPEHMGHVTIVDPNAGPDVLPAAKRVSNGKTLYRDPWAFSENCFLVANRDGIHVMDGQGNTELVCKLPGKSGMDLHEPRPLLVRQRERIIPSRLDLTKNTGTLFLADIYSGRAMTGVQPGEIKKLLVLEQLPKQVNFSGGMEPLTIGGTFTLARILGTVPVEPDGSAHLELPALRSLFFVALDKDDLAVKRMQSFVTLQPGEKTGCVGCHEQRQRTPHYRPDTLAMKRAPQRIEPIAGTPDVFDFPRHIQPIFDKHCVKCHNADKFEGKVDLGGDHTPLYSVSYWTINKHKLVADGRNQPYGNRAVRSIGSSASKLMEFIDGSHYDAKLSERERQFIRLWIETSATYPGTYASLGCGMYPVNYPQATLRERCANCHAGQKQGPRGPAFALNLESITNIDRPEKSLLLRAPLAKKAGGLGLCKGDVFTNTKDPDYQRILAAINVSATQLKEQKRFDMPGFRPNEHYVREMQRFGILPKDLSPEDHIDPYATDQAYWRSFWYRPMLGRN